jgi:hypothetical protein
MFVGKRKDYWSKNISTGITAKRHRELAYWKILQYCKLSFFITLKENGGCDRI